MLTISLTFWFIWIEQNPISMKIEKPYKIANFSKLCRILHQYMYYCSHLLLISHWITCIQKAINRAKTRLTTQQMSIHQETVNSLHHHLKSISICPCYLPALNLQQRLTRVHQGRKYNYRWRCLSDRFMKERLIKTLPCNPLSPLLVSYLYPLL